MAICNPTCCTDQECLSTFFIQGKKAFLIYDPQTHKVHESQDVHFFENAKSILECVTIEVEPYGSQTHVVIPIEDENADHVDERAESDMEMDSAIVDPMPEPVPRHSEPCWSGHTCHTPVPDNDTHYEVSTYNHESKTSDSVGVTRVLIVDVKVLHTYKDAMSHPDLDAWLEACMEELGALRETKTYTPVCEDEVDPHNVIGCCWVFTLKKGSDGEVECYKVHIVTKGFSQIYTINYEETFAPVVKWVSIHILLALAT